MGSFLDFIYFEESNKLVLLKENRIESCSIKEGRIVFEEQKRIDMTKESPLRLVTEENQDSFFKVEGKKIIIFKLKHNELYGFSSVVDD